MTSEIAVSVWERLSPGWGLVQRLGAWRSFDVETRFNDAGTWSLMLPLDGQSALITKQNLVTFDFRGHRVTGLIRQVAPQSDEHGKPVLEVSGVDALAVLGFVTCWPVPASALGAQGSVHYAATGAAETVLRNVIVANLVTRLAQNVTVSASLGRGTTVTLNERFSNLLTVVATGCETGGIGVRAGLVQSTSSTRAEFTVEFFVPVDASREVYLSHRVGSLRSWKQSDDAPSATRAIVGGGGKGAARLFRQVTASAAETEWGWPAETFVDARDTSDTALLDQRGTETLAETSAQASFELEAVDAEGMRYGDHYSLGDLVTVELMTGVSKVDRLRAVSLSQSDAGLTVQLKPGNPDAGNPMFGQSAIVRGLRRRLRNLEQEEV